MNPTLLGRDSGHRSPATCRASRFARAVPRPVRLVGGTAATESWRRFGRRWRTFGPRWFGRRQVGFWGRNG